MTIVAVWFIAAVYPSWDNTSRVAGRALITLDSTPENYERWLNRATHRTLLERQPSQRLVFINAWNEWAKDVISNRPEIWACLS